MAAEDALAGEQLNVWLPDPSSNGIQLDIGTLVGDRHLSAH